MLMASMDDTYLHASSPAAAKQASVDVILIRAKGSNPRTAVYPDRDSLGPHAPGHFGNLVNDFAATPLVQ